LIPSLFLQFHHSIIQISYINTSISLPLNPTPIILIHHFFKLPPPTPNPSTPPIKPPIPVSEQLTKNNDKKTKKVVKHMSIN
jgi:hypothetical protein